VRVEHPRFRSCSLRGLSLRCEYGDVAEELRDCQYKVVFWNNLHQYSRIRVDMISKNSSRDFNPRLVRLDRENLGEIFGIFDRNAFLSFG
jgi:hypothetical protein